MNEIVNKFLLAGDKFMPEMHVRRSGFTYSACGRFTKDKEYKNLKKRDSRYNYHNKLDKACFQQDMAYGDFKDLPRKTASDKILCDKAFNVAKNPKYDGYQRGLASMVNKYFDKKTSGKGVKNENMPDKPIIRKLEKQNVHPPFTDSI